MLSRSNLTKALVVLLGAGLLATMLLYNKELPSLFHKEISRCLLFRLGTTGIEVRYPEEFEDSHTTNTTVRIHSSKVLKTDGSRSEPILAIHSAPEDGFKTTVDQIVLSFAKPGPGLRFTKKVEFKGYPATVAEKRNAQLVGEGEKFYKIPFDNHVIDLWYTEPKLQEEIFLAEKMMDDIIIKNNYSNIEKPEVSDCQRWIWEH